MSEAEKSIVIGTVGEAPVAVIDDVFTDERWSLSSGEVLAKGADNGWGPPPLPSPPPEQRGAAEGDKEEEGGSWRPPDLASIDGDALELSAASTAELRSNSAALEDLESGRTVKLNLQGPDELRLSEISDFVHAATQGPGMLVVELRR